MTDNASEFRSQEFKHALAQLGAKHIYIRAGRPTSNGCVERVQQTCSRSAGSRPSPVI
jgi:transposase InsO family protein